MTTQLTARDKKLLWLMAWVLAIVGIGYFLIKPIYDDITDINLEIETVDFEAGSVRMKLTQLEDMEAQLSEAAQTEEAAGQRFYDPMKSSQIDNLLTTMVLDCGLSPVEMNISIQEGAAQLDAYCFSAAAQEEKTEPAELAGLQTAQVNMSCSGSQADAQALLDRLFTQEASILVTQFSWSQDNAQQNETDVSRLSLSLTIFMKQA